MAKKRKAKARSTQLHPERTMKDLKEREGLGTAFFPKMMDGSGKQVCPYCLEVIPGSSGARAKHNFKHDPRKETLKSEEAFQIAKGKK